LLGGVTSCHCTVLPQHRSCTIAASSQEAGAAAASISHIQPQRPTKRSASKKFEMLRSVRLLCCSGSILLATRYLSTLGPGRSEHGSERQQSVSCLQYCNLQQQPAVRHVWLCVLSAYACSGSGAHAALESPNPGRTMRRAGAHSPAPTQPLRSPPASAVQPPRVVGREKSSRQNGATQSSDHHFGCGIDEPS
jgi:hypothetical protein